jgi:hypothetical protein
MEAMEAMEVMGVMEVMEAMEVMEVMGVMEAMDYLVCIIDRGGGEHNSIYNFFKYYFQFIYITTF